MSALELQHSSLWWNGPSWLTQEKVNWPVSLGNPNPTTMEEKSSRQRKCKTQVLVSTQKISNHTNHLHNIFGKHSSFTRLRKIAAYVMIFIINCKTKRKVLQANSSLIQGKQPILLRTADLETGEIWLLKCAQFDSFSDVLKLLMEGETIKRSPLAQLYPFLDNNGLIRVGGRLKNAPVTYNQRHPVVLASSHELTHLLIKYEHERLLHAGCQAVIASLRTRYWPLSIKNSVKRIIRQCVKCFRAQLLVSNYSMGNLPASRVTPARPFSTCGVDYAGPFLIKDKLRSKTALKAYICIFVCFVKKAVHIELASDLSTQAFLNCFKRFISRRGRCNHIYSDNGKNFVGSKNELSELYYSIENHFQNYITSFLSSEQITWHFIPPYAPHFGGLWESAVKSTKYHLTRIIGRTRLTFEEFYTILTQIEACLNSRPLSPLSDNPKDLTPLTPGHFLIGDSLMTLPQQEVQYIKILPNKRYQYLQQMVQHFWSRWRKEYLHQLQIRYKHSGATSTYIKPGTMVLVMDENTAPSQWPLGRICEVHPGTDDVVRVVSIKTARGIVKRAITKICILPIHDAEEQKTDVEST